VCQKIDWNVQDIILASDPRTQETKFQVQKIIDLQHIANNLPNAVTDYKGVTKSYIPARNVPEKVKIPQKSTQPPKHNNRGKEYSYSSAKVWPEFPL
jgi:hypothetical protein